MSVGGPTPSGKTKLSEGLGDKRNEVNINELGRTGSIDQSGSRFTEIEKKDLSEMLKGLQLKAEDIIRTVNNSKLAVIDRISLINDPNIAELMNFFQSTKLDPDPFLSQLSQSAGKMVDTLFENFQPIKLEYDLMVFQQIHKAVLEKEAADREQELQQVVATIDEAIGSPFPDFALA